MTTLKDMSVVCYVNLDERNASWGIYFTFKFYDEAFMLFKSILYSDDILLSYQYFLS